MGDVTAIRAVKVEDGNEPADGASRTETSSGLPATSPKIRFRQDGMEICPELVHPSAWKCLANFKQVIKYRNAPKNLAGCPLP